MIQQRRETFARFLTYVSSCFVGQEVTDMAEFQPVAQEMTVFEGLLSSPRVIH